MNILQHLKKKGYRLTTSRQEIVNSLNDHPQTVQKIHSSLTKRGIDIDITSVYRTVELFVEMGIVYAIDLGSGSKQYELVDTKSHHHHLVCNTCGIVEDIIMNEESIMKELHKKTTFKVDHHHLEFFGYCADCQ